MKRQRRRRLQPCPVCKARKGCKHNIANVSKTKQSALRLLHSIEVHLEMSGNSKFQQFDCSEQTLRTIRKLVRAVSVRWCAKPQTHRKRLEQFARASRFARRVAYKNSMLVFSKATVDTLRHALPSLYGQGFLRRLITVHPYRPIDTFNAWHRVNVYRQGDRFDVIDANCNIPILAGISAKSLKETVSW